MASQPPLSLSLGHLRLSVTDLSGAIAFFEALGARQDVDRDNFAVMEFSDKTRLQLTGGASNIATDAPLQFDFRVKDIDSAWQECADNGLKPAPIARQTPGHDSFIVNGPDGYEIKINSGYKRA